MENYEWDLLHKNGPDIYEPRKHCDGHSLWCRLCNQWGCSSHDISRKHQKRMWHFLRTCAHHQRPPPPQLEAPTPAAMQVPLDDPWSNMVDENNDLGRRGCSADPRASVPRPSPTTPAAMSASATTPPQLPPTTPPAAMHAYMAAKYRPWTWQEKMCRFCGDTGSCRRCVDAAEAPPTAKERHLEIRVALLEDRLQKLEEVCISTPPSKTPDADNEVSKASDAVEEVWTGADGVIIEEWS